MSERNTVYMLAKASKRSPLPAAYLSWFFWQDATYIVQCTIHRKQCLITIRHYDDDPRYIAITAPTVGKLVHRICRCLGRLDSMRDTA